MKIGDKVRFHPSAWDGKTEFANGFSCPKTAVGTVIYVSKKGFFVVEAHVDGHTIRESLTPRDLRS